MKLLVNRTFTNNVRNDDGFLLIETLIAIGIISICLLSICRVQVAATNGTSTAKMSSQAGALASDQLERLLALDYTDVVLDETNPGERNENGYTIRWSVTDDPGGITNTKLITVIASSGNPNMAGKNVTLTSIKSRVIFSTLKRI